MNELNIISAKYSTPDNESITAVIDGETLSVPLDPANRHYAGILAWVEEGNTIADADPLPEPSYLELRQAEYGTPEQQMEFITENGLEAWQAKVAEIKAKYPKP